MSSRSLKSESSRSNRTKLENKRKPRPLRRLKLNKRLESCGSKLKPGSKPSRLNNKQILSKHLSHNQLLQPRSHAFLTLPTTKLRLRVSLKNALRVLRNRRLVKSNTRNRTTRKTHSKDQFMSCLLMSYLSLTKAELSSKAEVVNLKKSLSPPRRKWTPMTASIYSTSKKRLTSLKNDSIET